MPLRVAFMGSPDFAVPCLEALLSRPDVDVRVVVTQPDKPAGRGQKLTPPPVKDVALRHGLEVWQPPSVRKPPLAEVLAPLALDLIVVVAYGKILPPDLLATPRYGCWNVHGSLLPRYRGAAPIQWAVIRGEAETGVTLMQMDAGMDTGAMLLRRTLAINEDDTAATLFHKLAPIGASVLDEGISLLSAATPPTPTPQDPAQATMAPMLDKETGRVDWTSPARVVRDLVRGVDPWPGAFSIVANEPLKLWRAHLHDSRPADVSRPGTILCVDGDSIVIACGEGSVAIAEGQAPGRKRLPMSALIAGRTLSVGMVLGT